MTNDEKLMAQALEALENAEDQLPKPYSTEARVAIAALRDRLAQNLEMDEAIAAGDGTLHGALDYWQERALKAEARLAQKDEPSAEPVKKET